jgi:hypothetical protein
MLLKRNFTPAASSKAATARWGRAVPIELARQRDEDFTAALAGRAGHALAANDIMAGTTGALHRAMHVA